ncbi:hypothetical protein [Flavobacterium sp.]|uniref:hypothetical protein n=1 Tax=Flavobacterium sp. TaxID=239 RepID=UPI0037501580
MKKIILLLSVMTLAFTSCSKNEDEPAIPTVDPNGILLKRSVETDSNGANIGAVFTLNYIYNGNKLVRINDSDGDYEIITYTGDLITKWEYFISPAVLDLTVNFTYNVNNDLIKAISINHGEATTYPANYVGKTNFTHNSNGSISFQEYNGNLTAQTTAVSNGTITSGSIVTNEINPASTVTETCSYDTKNHPLKNVLGYNKIIFNDFFNNSSNNFISITNYQGDLEEASYTYNTNNFPITEIYKMNSVTQSTTQYFYE